MRRICMNHAHNNFLKRFRSKGGAVTNHKLTLEMLKEISNSDDVLIAGDYTGKYNS
jgi:hypothetical protein